MKNYWNIFLKQITDFRDQIEQDGIYIFEHNETSEGFDHHRIPLLFKAC